MDVKLFNDTFLGELHGQAKENVRKRQNYDLRTSESDTSQRMLNALEVGTKVPIHRHLKTSESVICIEGRLDWVFYEDVKGIDKGETASDETNFVEVARCHICPREKKYGIQVPISVWHSVEVLEPSTIFEAKDGAYQK